MAFKVPNNADAAFPDQAQLDSGDLEIMAAGNAETGVVSGCAVTTTGTGNGSVSVASGSVLISRRKITVGSATVAITANSSGNPRLDLITVGTSGTPAATAGTAATNPVYPAIPASSAVLAAVYVPNGHGASTTVPANTITDKRVTVPESPYRTAAAGDPGNEWFWKQTDTDQVMMRWEGKQHTGPIGEWANVLLEVDDYNGAPIWWVNGAGGSGITDDLYTAYSVFGDYPFRADIYGYQWRKSQCTFSFGGPPGNMLDWNSACHEVYQQTRDGNLGMWGAVGACTIATGSMSLPPTTSPTGYKSYVRLTNTTGGTAWIATWGGGTALDGVVAGEMYSFAINVRANSAAAARNANVRISWFTSGGTQVGSDINGSNVSIPTDGTWTPVTLSAQIAPATAARVQLHLLVASANTETHDMCGAAILRETREAKFAPPFVGQRPVADPPQADGAVAGDRWVRTDATQIPGRREYVCTTGTIADPAQPRYQYWRPVESADIVRLLADETRTSTTPTAITRFAYAVAADSEYTFEWKLSLTSAATTTGWIIGLTGPASPTSIVATHEYQSSATAWTTATISSFTNFTTVTAAYSTTAQIQVRVTCQLVTGSTAGTVNLNVATEVASSTITIKRGSLMNVM